MKSVFALVILAALVARSGSAYADGLKQSVEMSSGALGSLPDASCGSPVAQLVAADTNQECAILVNVGSNHARIGDSNVGASQGADYAPGATITLCTTSPIYCYSASGTTIAITKLQQ